MVCSRCKKHVSDKLLLCPYCGSPLNKNKTHNNANNQNKKAVKNKYINQDSTNLVGGVTSSGSTFVKLQKKAPKEKEIVRKDYINYLDYKEAKDDLKDKELAKNLEKKTTESIYGDKKNNIKEYKQLVEKVEFDDKKTGANKAKMNYAKNSAVAEMKSRREKDLDSLGNVNKTNGYDSGIKNQEMNNNILNTNTNFIDDLPKTFVNNKPSNNLFMPNVTPNTVLNNQPNTPINRNNSGGYKPSNGRFITLVNSPKNNNRVLQNANKTKRKTGLKFSDIVACVFTIAIWGFVIFTIFKYSNNSYYFESNNSNLENTDITYDGVSKSKQESKEAKLGVTSIVYDNQYLKQPVLNNINDVNKLISNDSVKQKSKCPPEIVKIEQEIISKYEIVAVNFCEMNVGLANELKDVVAYIYDNYPNAHNYLTNITIANVSENDKYIAAFMPVFTFATSNTSTGFPWAVKTQIILNAKYFLNEGMLENSVNNGASSGYFPPNANKSSTVAHELGHYLSYIALLKYYQTNKLNYVTSNDYRKLKLVYNDFLAGDFSYKLLFEAYELYQSRYMSLISFDDFRASISKYAMAVNSSGDYIYDETIAEAFHDVYLNGNDAKDASKIIVEVLKSKL